MATIGIVKANLILQDLSLEKEEQIQNNLSTVYRWRTVKCEKVSRKQFIKTKKSYFDISNLKDT